MKIIGWIIGLAAVGVAAYYGWKYYKKNNPGTPQGEDERFVRRVA